MKAVIIAGGLGTRLRPLTNEIPKPIVPVANRPFIVHQIEHLVRHGAQEVIICLQHLSHEIKKAIGDGKEWGIKIHYSLEKEPLGTAGAVKNAEEYFDDQPLVIFNGDVLTELNITKLVKFHREKKAAVTLTLKEVDDPTPFGLVLTEKDGRVKQFIEKPSWNMVTAKTINAGTYVVDPRIFEQVPKGKPYSFERELYPLMLEQGAPIFGYLSTSYWVDIGDHAKYREAHRAILSGEVAVVIHGTRIDGKIWLGRGTHPHASVKLIGPCIIGADVKLGRGTEVREQVVIGDRVSIGEHCSLERAIIWEGTNIGKNCVLSDCIIGRNCQIEEGVFVEHGTVLAGGSVVRKGTRLAA